MNKTQIGDISEQKFILYCLKKEIPISKPIGNNLPYDFIIDYNNNLYKIQVKTAYRGKTPDSWVFNTRSCSKNYNEVTTSNYIGKIDYFVSVNPENDIICFIPIKKAGLATTSIYYGDNPKPNQNYYKDFLNP